MKTNETAFLPFGAGSNVNGMSKGAIREDNPLGWCFGEGIVIDMKHKQDFDPITSKDIIEYLENENLALKPNTIVLIKTGRDQFMGTKDFFENNIFKRRILKTG